MSSYGPYTSIVGTAKKTGVAGLTAEPEMGGDRGEVVAAKDAEIAALKKQLEALGVAASRAAEGAPWGQQLLASGVWGVLID